MARIAGRTRPKKQGGASQSPDTMSVRLGREEALKLSYLAARASCSNAELFARLFGDAILKEYRKALHDQMQAAK